MEDGWGEEVESEFGGAGCDLDLRHADVIPASIFANWNTQFPFKIDQNIDQGMPTQAKLSCNARILYRGVLWHDIIL